MNRGKWANLKKGNILKMRPGNFRFKVREIRKYKSFKEMLKKEGLKNVLPDQININKGVEVYRKYYSTQDEKKFGVLALRAEMAAD